MAQYANGFAIIANKETGELVITFVQDQPKFNPESGGFDQVNNNEVATMIMPLGLGIELAKHIEKVAEQEKNKE